MKARYIGEESAPGSRSTKLFGITVYCDQIFDVPPAFENKARVNPYVEVIEDEAPKPAAFEDAPAATKTRKRKEKDNGESVA